MLGTKKTKKRVIVMAGCKRCGGKGYLKSVIVQDGICFQCDGLGDEKKAREIRKDKETQMNARWVEELKNDIANAYLTINKTKIIGGNARKERVRKDAAEKYKTLKEKFGIVLSIEEIKEIAKGLK
jgi:uncharacterized glyoxalase superfamily protein PhnB